MPEVPTPIRVALGIAATAADELRKVPDRLPAAAAALPMIAVSTTLQASMHLQQQLAVFAARGDEVLAHLRRSSDEPPQWATFDDDSAPAGGPAAAFDTVTAQTEEELADAIATEAIAEAIEEAMDAELAAEVVAEAIEEAIEAEVVAEAIEEAIEEEIEAEAVAEAIEEAIEAEAVAEAVEAEEIAEALAVAEGVEAETSADGVFDDPPAPTAEPSSDQ